VPEVPRGAPGYLVRVDWITTVPREKAIWEKGMFANQNIACKLRNKFTLDRITERFSVGDQRSSSRWRTHPANMYSVIHSLPSLH
jgi:hypothetical protein